MSLQFTFQPQQVQNSTVQSNPQPNQLNPSEEYKNLSSKINTQLNSFDVQNPKGIVNQSLKNAVGLNFKKFNNSYSENLHNLNVDKIYLLSHNLRSNIDKNKIPQQNFDISRFKAPKFEQISNNILNKEKDLYREFVEKNGDIELNNLNNINNITF